MSTLRFILCVAFQDIQTGSRSLLATLSLSICVYWGLLVIETRSYCMVSAGLNSCLSLLCSGIAGYRVWACDHIVPRPPSIVDFAGILYNNFK